MTSYTHHRNMDALRYECTDVSAEKMTDSIIYYIHHKNREAVHYGGADVSSEDPTD
jgi:hypothetical protein